MEHKKWLYMSQYRPADLFECLENEAIGYCKTTTHKKSHHFNTITCQKLTKH